MKRLEETWRADFIRAGSRTVKKQNKLKVSSSDFQLEKDFLISQDPHVFCFC